MQQVEDNLKVVVSEGERLTKLIDDVLDLAKIEAGKLEWHMEPTSVAEIIDRATAATASLFEQKGLRLVTDVAPDLPVVTGDRDRLIQVVINLISNAVKFTDAGSVTCRAARRGGEIVVSVVDTGMGIAPADQPKVFERFKQVGDTLTDKPKGTGLGLPICREIVEHHGGRVWVESELGQGQHVLVLAAACQTRWSATWRGRHPGGARRPHPPAARSGRRHHAAHGRADAAHAGRGRRAEHPRAADAGIHRGRLPRERRRQRPRRDRRGAARAARPGRARRDDAGDERLRRRRGAEERSGDDGHSDRDPVDRAGSRARVSASASIAI